MPRMLRVVAPAALALTCIGAVSAWAENNGSTRETPDRIGHPQDELTDVASPLGSFYQSQLFSQVRVEQRLTIRVAPQRSREANPLLDRLPRRALTNRYEERQMDTCVPINRISGVQTGRGNRLLLFLNDERIVSINLERTCRARDFYSGFYVERSDDGKLCVDRDHLQSRSGAKCEVERMRQLVAVER
ncbi:MAG: hypothetical protein V2J51_01890 [Erythrobacter sp.]|nr:hypothetical protein [Erythrobacter sp.]